MSEQLGDQPIETRFREQMIAAMQALDEAWNPGLKAPEKTVGIIILVFPYGSHDGRCNYISNGANRRDVVTMMREQIARFEGQPELGGTA